MYPPNLQFDMPPKSTPGPNDHRCADKCHLVFLSPPPVTSTLAYHYLFAQCSKFPAETASDSSTRLVAYALLVEMATAEFEALDLGRSILPVS